MKDGLFGAGEEEGEEPETVMQGKPPMVGVATRHLHGLLGAKSPVR